MNTTQPVSVRFRRLSTFAPGWAASLLMLWLSSAAWGQPQEDPTRRPRMDTSTPGQPLPPGVGVVKEQGRPFYLQGAIVVLLTGGAVWTVCRSSRRQ